MDFRKGERAHIVDEPLVFGHSIDPTSAAVFDEFAIGRTYSEIYDIWIDPEITDLTVRQRAVAVLTAPGGVDLPFPNPNQSIGSVLNHEEIINGQPTTSMHDRFIDRPVLAEELGLGVLYWLNKTGGSVENVGLASRASYQFAILRLIPLVTEETAEKLFEHFEINSLRPYKSVDFASGYQPLQRLLMTADMPAKFKDLVLAKLFDIADQEEQGLIDPRDEHERATSVMAEFIELYSCTDNADDNIPTAVVAFLENHASIGSTYIDKRLVSSVALHINDKDLCFKFAWRHVFVGPSEEYGQFAPETSLDLELLDWLSDEAKRRGFSQFEDTANRLRTEYFDNNREQIAKKAAETAIRNRLRNL